MKSTEPTSPRKKTLLNGTWQLQPSNDESLPATWSHSVPVPAMVDSAQPRYNWKDFKYHWHRVEFRVPGSRDLAFIVLEQAMFGTEVWMNGEHVGGDIACYTSQEHDVSKSVKVGEKNELIVRIGQRSDLPEWNAAGNDQERTEWIPGIWGDVFLVQCGNPRIKFVQVISHIETSMAEVRVTAENRSAKEISVTVASSIHEKRSGKEVTSRANEHGVIAAGKERTFVVHLKLSAARLWSPEHPFLYEVLSTVSVDDVMVDDIRTTFGMREFKIVGADFYFNGKKILLRGGNIAFHRFLADADRGALPWNLDWVKRLLIDIPKSHNFNFFRNHIGQMYNRWYDIADEHGMLLQNEWMFWTTTGSREQITKEFTRWLQDNWNHPSIIMWDALNECSDEIVQKQIVPEMKKLDPTRPWESVDVVEEHPYIYSLGPVLNDRKFGFTRSLDEIERSTRPTMLNEFCWWWLDKEYNPSLLTKQVVERWLGPSWTKEQLIEHQSFLAQELVELFRRMQVDAIQPFVYLSNNAGPTANWFEGDIKDLKPKPILQALKNAFSPFGVSIELWDRHFVPNESRQVRVFVFNDSFEPRSGTLSCGVVNAKGEWLFETRQAVAVEPSGFAIVSMTIVLPSRPGEYAVRASLQENGIHVASSEKVAHVIAPPEASVKLHKVRIAILDGNNELATFLEKMGLSYVSLSGANLRECDMLIVGEGMLRVASYQVRLGAITKFLESGKTVVVVEPEFESEDGEILSAALGVELRIEKRVDADKGGYDSYVFAENASHPLWNGISPDHLKMFNGGHGGEIVSQHTVTPTAAATVLARCGLELGVHALFEIACGSGRIIVSRLQQRGRLVCQSGSQSLFARRPDPVMQRYVLNLISYASGEWKTHD